MSRRSVLLALVAAAPLAHAQTPDSVRAVASDTLTFLTGQKASGTPYADEPSWERPTWGESMIGAGGVLAGITVGGLAGLSVSYVVCQTGASCNDWDGLGFVLLPVAVGAVGGGYVGARTVRRGYGRGSASGALLGYLVGSSLGSALTGTESGESNPLAGVVTFAAAVGGGAFGFRYGPGAHGPGLARRTSVSVVPVATPQGQGVYAVVRF